MSAAVLLLNHLLNDSFNPDSPCLGFRHTDWLTNVGNILFEANKDLLDGPGCAHLPFRSDNGVYVNK